MGMYCKECGKLIEEDDDRLCPKCEGKNRNAFVNELRDVLTRHGISVEKSEPEAYEYASDEYWFAGPGFTVNMETIWNEA